MRTPALLVALLVPLSLAAQSPAAPTPSDPWSAWRHLLGEWDSANPPGQGQGHFSFAPDLGGKVLVRRHAADVPAAEGRPGGHHEDLMVVYPASDGAPYRAMYFDNEGHVIAYAAAVQDDGRTVVLTSDAAPGAPRFRLTYLLPAEGPATVRFEMAPPGTPDAFSVYLEGKAVRKAAPAR